MSENWLPPCHSDNCRYIENVHPATRTLWREECQRVTATMRVHGLGLELTEQDCVYAAMDAFTTRQLEPELSDTEDE